MSKLRLVILLSILLAGCDHAAAPTAVEPDRPKPQSLPTTQLTIGAKPFTLQIAATEDQRKTGLMYVRSMPADRGMIFLFPVEQVLNFWMQNTPIDLDILYVDRANHITAIKTMHAFDTTGISSEDPADVAIELNRGVAATTGVAVGDTLAIPAALRAQAR